MKSVDSYCTKRYLQVLCKGSLTHTQHSYIVQLGWSSWANFTHSKDYFALVWPELRTVLRLRGQGLLQLRRIWQNFLSNKSPTQCDTQSSYHPNRALDTSENQWSKFSWSRSQNIARQHRWYFWSAPGIGRQWSRIFTGRCARCGWWLRLQIVGIAIFCLLVAESFFQEPIKYYHPELTPCLQDWSVPKTIALRSATRNKRRNRLSRWHFAATCKRPPSNLLFCQDLGYRGSLSFSH